MGEVGRGARIERHRAARCLQPPTPRPTAESLGFSENDEPRGGKGNERLKTRPEMNSCYKS